MRLTTFSEDNCYTLITNCSKGTKGVAERLKNQKVFKDVYYKEVYGLNEKNTLKHKWFYLKGAIFGNKKCKLNDEEMLHDEFNPVTSTSFMPGTKAMRLYNAVCVMIDILQDDDYGEDKYNFSKGYYIEFYSSY